MAHKNIQTVFMDGSLTQAEALAALSAAAQSATEALPYALLKCAKREEMQQVIAARDTCQLAFTNALARSLQHTGPLFEQTAAELTTAAQRVSRNLRTLKDAAEAVELLSECVRLAARLALAFA